MEEKDVIAGRRHEKRDRDPMRGATAKAFFRTVSVPEHKTLGYIGVDAKGEILKHPSALKDAYDAGKELVKV